MENAPRLPPPGADATLVVEPDRLTRRVLIACIVCEALLVLLDGAIAYGAVDASAPIRRLFNITREDSIASVFAVLQTFAVAAVAAWIALVCRAQGGGRRCAGWCFLVLLFAYIAVDDGAQIHERIGSAFTLAHNDANAGLGARALAAYPSYSWQLVFMPAFGLAGVVLLAFLWRELVNARARGWLLGALGLQGGAIALDFAEKPKLTYAWWQSHWGASDYAISHGAKMIEESMEMLAITFFLTLFIRHLAQISPRVTIDFRVAPSPRR